MPSKQLLDATTNPEVAVGNLLTCAKLLNTPKLSRFYVYVLWNSPVAIETVKDDLDLPHSTAYKYVGELKEMDVLTRHEETRPTMIEVEPIQLKMKTDDGDMVVTPVLVDAVARQFDTKDIRVFVGQQGIPKLAAALHYTLRVMNGDLTQRTAATKLNVHPVEGMTVITALQDVVETTKAYDPHLEADE